MSNLPWRQSGPGPVLPPVLVGFEGIDGSGKSTQAARLAASLGAFNIHFPVYDSPTGRLIKDALKTGANPYLTQSLMVTNRLEIADTIRQMLFNSSVVLDRYVSSGLAYGRCQGIDPRWLNAVNVGVPMPDLYFLIDVPSDVSFERRPERQDAMEADKPLLDAVRREYNIMWNMGFTPWSASWRDGIVRFKTLDGTLPPDELASQILAETRRVQQEIAGVL